jgi:hypothetical protein
MTTCKRCGAALSVAAIWEKASTPNPVAIAEWWVSEENGWECPASPGDGHEVQFITSNQEGS